jgi:hypothetical protein
MASKQSGVPLAPMMEDRDSTRHCISLLGCSFRMPCDVETSTWGTVTSSDRMP